MTRAFIKNDIHSLLEKWFQCSHDMYVVGWQDFTKSEKFIAANILSHSFNTSIPQCQKFNVKLQYEKMKNVLELHVKDLFLKLQEDSGVTYIKWKYM